MKRLYVGLLSVLAVVVAGSVVSAGPYNTYAHITADGYASGKVTAYQCLSGRGSSGALLNIGDAAMGWVEDRLHPIAPYGTVVTPADGLHPVRLRQNNGTYAPYTAFVIRDTGDGKPGIGQGWIDIWAGCTYTMENINTVNAEFTAPWYTNFFDVPPN